ncbi:hypothetical protein ASG73_06355 [Janibacter sp. Soil728]|uniref:TetR/AcrR family transcriptional regulator n=1 Tax=Janibacter sp. Soil728 TaxID=1736393 RepID=UPI0006F737E0|nr:TetR/AcrR family transcriptional regulator [Janibacter sp. Soil728]KRE38544.1 hypothetical protein ASG73_06355 [Janibacter sp. Soil728]
MSGGRSESSGIGAARRERLHRQVLEEIKDAARAELRAHGPSGVTMRAVARAVDITPSGLYRYVADHNALLGLLAADAYAEALAEIRAAGAQAPDEEFATTWYLSTLALRRWSLTHEAEHALLVSPTVMNPRPREVVEAVRESLAMWAEICEKAIQAGQLDPQQAGLPVVHTKVTSGAASAEAVSLARSAIAAITGHIALEVRLGWEGWEGSVEDPAEYFSDYSLAIMTAMGFVVRPTMVAKATG